MVDEWQYHQDGRDDAAGVGCVTILAVLVAVLTLAIAACVGGA